MKKTIKDIAVFGAGGFGMEVAMLIEQINAEREAWRMIGYFDDGESVGDMIYGYEVLGGMDALNAWETELWVVFAIGMPKIKKLLVERVHNANIRYPVLTHPSVLSGRPEYTRIGAGSIICAGNIITTDITIGKHVILNLACTVGHETRIGDFCSFMPSCNISGEVNIGDANFWGTGAKVINQQSIGDHVIIGAGAVVIHDIPDNVTAVGVPAKVVKEG